MLAVALPSVLTLLAAAVLAFSSHASAAVEAKLPATTGSREVGTRALEVVDRSRRAGFGLSGPRRLMVQITYPREAGARCRPAPYAPGGIVDRIRREVELDDQLEIETGICRGGAMRRGRHPVLVLSHAYLADRFLYTALAGELASHGFIVASIDHTGEAFSVRFPGRGYVDGIYGGVLTGAEPDDLGSLVDVRSADASFVLSRLRTLGHRANGLLGDHVGRAAGVLGHSLGGATATQAAIEDGRFDAAANLDGELWSEPALSAAAPFPYLMAVAGDAPVAAAFRALNVCDFYQRARGSRFAWLLPDAMHFSYSDFQVIAPAIAAQVPGWAFAGTYPSVVGTVDPEVSIASQRQALVRYFESTLVRRRGMPPPPGAFTAAPESMLDCL